MGLKFWCWGIQRAGWIEGLVIWAQMQPLSLEGLRK